MNVFISDYIYTSFSRIISLSSFMDHAEPWQIGFQFPASPVMYGIIELHNHICFFLVFIIVFTFYMLIFILVENSIELFNNNKEIYNKVNKLYNIRILHNVSLETLWIILPTILLLAIAIPSFSLLYAMEVSRDCLISMKVIGHQWYWAYDITFTNIKKPWVGNSYPHLIFDSYMVPDGDISNQGLRLLETTNPVVLPTKTNIKVLVTSSDVLHSWTVPSFGVKIDACPGRLNQIMLYIDRIGHFYGQCSELCGVNHGFMPIEVYSIPKTEYITYYSLVSSDFRNYILGDYCSLYQKGYLPLYGYKKWINCFTKIGPIDLKSIDTSVLFYKIPSFNKDVVYKVLNLNKN